MLHLRNKILFLSLFFYLTTYTQVISTINVEGAINFSKENYLEWIHVPINSQIFFSINDTITTRIQSNLIRKGYFNSHIKINQDYENDSQSVNLVIKIDEGNPSYINEVYINGVDSSDGAYFEKNLEFIRGSIYSETKLEQVINSILDFYEENGFPFASLIISAVEVYDDSVKNKNFVNVFLRVDKKNASKIDRIEVKGNYSTKDYVITRELDLTIGENYSQKKINKIPSKLNKLRFFEPVNVPVFYFNSRNEGILSIEVKEKQTNNFDGIIGYIPGSGKNEKGYITGLVNINMRNLFGTGRAAAIRWQKVNRNSQELELKYLEPWFLNYPFNLQFGFFQRKQDTIYVQRKIDASIEFRASDEISFSLLLGSEQVIPTLNDYSIFTVYNSSVLTTGINIKIDSRDDPYSPTSGFLFINSYSYSRKKINGPTDFITPDMETKINLQRLAVEINFYYELFIRNIIAVGIHAKELKGPMFEFSDLYFLGGTNSLRGYRENQFMGSRVAWSNLEYRVLLTPRSYAFLFFDSGYYLRKADEKRKIEENSAFKIGYGLGLTIETSLGVLGVSFALAKGDSFGEGKIHFGIVNEF